jgi:hypothetical protein
VRVIEIAGVLVALAGVGFGIRALWDRSPKEVSGGWEATHRYEHGARHVYVRRGRELEPIGKVVVGAADYDERFMRLMDQARERAAVLNTEPQ